MVVNQSQKRSRAEWIRWYESGAVAQEVFPVGSLVVDAISRDVAAGYQTLSLGSQLVSQNELGSVYEPIVCVVVPLTTKFELDQVLDRLPANAIPLDIFFPED